MRRSLICVLCLAAGCATVTAPRVGVTALASTQYPSRSSDHPVTLFQTQLPHCAFEEVALVTVRPQTFWTTSEKLVDLLRTNARRLGGDAVIHFKSESTVEGASPSAGGSIEIDHGLLLSGTVIRFRDPACTE